jgi:hypothetical protein
LEEVIALLDCEEAAWLRAGESAAEFAQFRAISHLYEAVSLQADLSSQCERLLALVRLRQALGEISLKTCPKNRLLSSFKRIFAQKNSLCKAARDLTQQTGSATSTNPALDEFAHGSTPTKFGTSRTREFHERCLVDSHVFVVLFYCLTVFFDLNGIGIEDTN